MRINSIRFVLLILFFVGGNAVAQSTALNYQDCILEATREGYAQDWKDVGRIKQSCEEKFPESAPKILGERLKNDSLEEVEIYTHAENDGSVKGTVYNGNSHVFLTRIHIILTPRKGDPVQDLFDSEEFEITLKIPPNKTDHFTIPAEETKVGHDFRTQLIKAWGY